MLRSQYLVRVMTLVLHFIVLASNRLAGFVYKCFCRTIISCLRTNRYFLLNNHFLAASEVLMGNIKLRSRYVLLVFVLQVAGS